MIASMTGYGAGETTMHGITASVELRSVNSRFLEVATRLPRSLSLKDNEIKDIIRKRVTRGKITLLVSIERENSADLPLKINTSAARAYVRLLQELKTAVKIKETVKLDHLLKFSEVLEVQELERSDDEEWEVCQRALGVALDNLIHMRQNEGGELRRDLEGRIAVLNDRIARIEQLSLQQVPAERERLRERIRQLLEGEPVDEGRLELEIALMADKLDVTEECVRFRSHNKFFLEALDGHEAAGRKLNFLVQEMNREANTIGSKSSAAEIAHLVVGVKEELERIREQLQNIE